MNNVTLIGTLTRDPEMRGQGDSQVCAMRLVERNGRAADPLYMEVAAFGRQAESCMRYLKKGRHVAVAGRLRFREWKAKDGSRRSELTIAAGQVEFLSGGASGTPQKDADPSGE